MIHSASPTAERAKCLKIIIVMELGSKYVERSSFNTSNIIMLKNNAIKARNVI